MISSIRVLIVGSTAHWCIESLYRRAFEAIGCRDVAAFDTAQFVPAAHHRSIAWKVWRRYRAISAPARLGRALEATVRETRFDLIVVFKGLYITAQALEKCRDAAGGAIWVNINPDDPLSINASSSNANIRDTLPLYDCYYIWSRRLVPRLVEAGCRRVEYLPFGYDPLLHNPSADAPQPGLISFIGSWDSEREHILTALAEMPLRIYGNGWEKVARSSPLARCIVRKPVFGAEASRITSTSLVAINLLRPQNIDAHNMRTFEIPAMRGCMVTTATQEQTDFFPFGKASLGFARSDELVGIVDDLLSHPARSVELREAAYELSRPHAYASRARAVIESLDL